MASEANLEASVVTAYAKARQRGDARRWFDAASTLAAAPTTTTSMPLGKASALYFSNDSIRECRAVLRMVTVRLLRRGLQHLNGDLTSLISEYIPWSSVVPTFSLAMEALRRRRNGGGDSDSGSVWHACLHRPTAQEKAWFSGQLLFVRVITTNPVFGGEELNRYFGRYGFLRETRLDETTGRAVPTTAPAVSVGPALYQFAYVLTMDSEANAERAIEEETLEHTIQFVSYAAHAPDAGAAHLTQFRQSPWHSCYVRLASLPTAAALATALGRSLAALKRPTAADELDDGVDQTAFVPDLVVDHVPFWMTPEQLSEHLRQSGRVRSIRIATCDRSGAFLGCAAVRMATFVEAVRASADLNGKDLGGDEPVVCGVIDRDLNIVDLLNPSEVLLPSRRKNRGVLDMVGPSRPQPPPPAYAR